MYIKDCIDVLLKNLYIPINSSEKKKLEKDIEEIYAFKSIGAQIRSRTAFLENNEVNTKLFLGLEKSRQTRKVLHKLTVNDKHYSNINDILTQEKLFYEKLYSSENINIMENKQYLNDITLNNTLSSEDASVCNGFLKYEEGKIAVSEMKNNKSPGLDGLTVEFYQTFWNKIEKIVVNSLNEGFLKKELSISQKQGVLSLLYKKGDPENIENWRPITLLNTDYKILTRILARRLQKVIFKIIETDQQGYIKNRCISLNS